MPSETGETGKAGIIVASDDAPPMDKLVSRAVEVALHSANVDVPRARPIASLTTSYTMSSTTF